jgi:hypothetical protein
MTAINEYTLAIHERRSPFLPSIRKRLKKIATDAPANYRGSIFSSIRTLNLADGYAPIGYMQLHGVSPPGFTIAGIMEKTQEECSCNFKVKFNLRFYWIDDINPNANASGRRFGDNLAVNAAATFASLEKRRLPRDFRMLISWKSKSTS